MGKNYSPRVLGILDLHGVALVEARELVSEMVRGFRGQSGVVRIIVGKGLHSSGGAVLGPEVKRWIAGWGLSWSYAKIADGGEGCLVVRMG